MLNTVTGALIYALKAFFSLVTWFGKSFFKLVKLVYVVIPITCIVLVLLFCANIFILFGNSGQILSSRSEAGGITSDVVVPEIDIPGNIVSDDKVRQGAGYILDHGTATTVRIFGDLYSWWMKAVYFYHGSLSYIPLFILTVLMFIPVVSVLLVFSVLASYSNLLFFTVVADAFLYVVRAVLGSSFIKQALSRYYRLFPEAGRRHYEKNYDKWLKNRNREIESEERNSRRRRGEGFYEDEGYEDPADYEDEYEDRDFEDEYYGDSVDYEDDYEDEDYDEDYEDGDYDDSVDYEDDYENRDSEDEYYGDSVDYEDDYEDEEYEDEDYAQDDYEDEYYEDRNPAKRHSSSSAGTFDFFVGCNSKESVDKKYKSLVKLYHPDNMDGDTAALQEINAQYAQAKKKFS